LSDAQESTTAQSLMNGKCMLKELISSLIKSISASFVNSDT